MDQKQAQRAYNQEPPLLPDITSDEGVDPYEDEDYLREVPPHHGR